MRAAGENKKTLRYLGYGVLAVLIFALQSSRLCDISLFSATADYMPFLIAALAVYENPYVAGVTGFFAGLMLSLRSFSIEGIDSLFLSLFGVFFAYLAMTFFRENVFFTLVGGGVSLFTTELLKYVFYYLLADGVGISTGLLYITGKLIISAPGGLVTVLTVRRIAHDMRREES